MKLLLINPSVAAENFEPEYLRINPNGTVPSLLIPFEDKILTDTREILEFLDRYSNSVKSPSLNPSDAETILAVNSLIELVHSSELDTNLILLAPRNETELEAKKSGMWNDFVANRQAALERLHSAEPENPFYSAKVKENGALSRLYTAKPDREHDIFFKDTEAKYRKFAAAMDDLNAQLRLPYAAGNQVTLADLHIVPWLSHALAGVGTTDPSDFSKFDAHIQQTVPGFHVGRNIRAWWKNFSERDSFKEVH